MRDSSIRANGPGLLLAVLHFVLGMRLIADPRVMHDEGQAMYGFSRSLSEAFIPCLFFQKIKPALALFYALPARLGFVTYLVVHLLVGSLAVWLLFRVAQSMKQRRPWIPALVLAASPLYAWSSATGIANADGVAAIVLFLYLLERRRSFFLAGVVLGALPWVRFETVVFCIVFAPFVIVRDRRPRFLAGLFTWPVLYALGGALYHRDPLWFVHLQPTSGGLQPWNDAEAQVFSRHSAATAIESLLCVSPALVAISFCRFRRLGSLERALLFFTLAFSALYVATHFRPVPIGPLFIVGFVMRHAVLPIGAAALLVGRAVEALENDRAGERPLVLLVGWIALGVLARRAGAGPAVLVGAAVLALFVAATRAGVARWGLAAFVAFVVAGPVMMRAPMTRDGFSREAALSHRSVEEMTGALEALAPSAREVVYTNSHLLHPFLERTGRLAGTKVIFVLGRDMTYEMTAQTNPNNGQRAAVLRAIPRATFGESVAIEEVRPDRLPAGSIVALVDDARNEQAFPTAVWASHLQPLPSPRGMQLAIVR